MSPTPFYYFIAPMTHIAQTFLHLKCKKSFFKLKKYNMDSENLLNYT